MIARMMEHMTEWPRPGEREERFEIEAPQWVAKLAVPEASLPVGRRDSQARVEPRDPLLAAIAKRVAADWPVGVIRERDEHIEAIERQLEDDWPLGPATAFGRGIWFGLESGEPWENEPPMPWGDIVGAVTGVGVWLGLWRFEWDGDPEFTREAIATRASFVRVGG
jgi:hypothetical protein